MRLKVSVVIRTLNEEKYLSELLSSINSQVCDFDVEVVLIDSGSTDSTVLIAEEFSANVTYIDKKDFTFGRSLNEGCRFATGEIFVLISGHCVPCSEFWLSDLCAPIIESEVGYTYGRQQGRDTTNFSEERLFAKYYLDENKIPQRGYFVNNANSAIARAVWEKFLFDENILGLEDMELAKRYTATGGKLGYVASAAVYHIHDESWGQIKRRYEREAIALRQIWPEVKLPLHAAIRYFVVAIVSDLYQAFKLRVLCRNVLSILQFRSAQYWGAVIGSNRNERLNALQRESYFYPRRIKS